MREAFRQRGILSDNNRGKEMKYIVWHQRENSAHKGIVAEPRASATTWAQRRGYKRTNNAG